ncbi:MAG: sugar ABC transporter ATP-binding protein [Phycisphaerae bacterium]|jgi:ribose transport system ATP-binding protein|nr:sugar ABC transporter ATP-binding protein [Phycisphaerae bacterium]
MNYPNPASDPPLVEMKGIVKRFPGVIALDGVDFELRPGEVHVLLGENGAGKSTLIKVLSGAHGCDEGEILIGGRKVNITSPQVPLEMGLRFIYQEINLVAEIDIARNMFLGCEPMLSRALGLVDKSALYRRAAEYLRRFHIDLDPHDIVGELSVTQQKMVEIARALVTESKVIVLDEPTDVLEDRSRNDLFEVIGRLKSTHQVGFIYISHRYAEVYELGDRVTILRDGRNVGTHRIEDLTLDEMIERMVGRQVSKQYPALPAPQDDEAIRVENIASRNVLNGVSLSVRQGEILAVTGLMGAGKTELGRAIAGVDRFDSGAVYVHGRPVVSKSPAAGIRNGIAYLTEDRKSEGLILDHSIRNNYALPSIGRLSPKGLLNHSRINREAREYMTDLKIKAPDIHTPAGQLSGGNQQKAVLAKWLGTNCKVLIFDEPTRGIDINGRAEVYRIMEELLERGVAILMLTSDYTEALAMSHRVVVLSHGRTAGTFDRGTADEEDILRLAIGSSADQHSTGSITQ